MPKTNIRNIYKNNKTVQNRNRARIFRTVNSILIQDRNQISTNLQFDQLPRKSINLTHRRSLTDQLRSWAIEFHITQRSLSKLLKILVSCGIHSLPKDSRTLLSTPRSIDIQNRAGGQYYHHGIKKSLCSIFSELDSNLTIKMNVNVDGLPLFKSSSVEFWPILANIRGKYEID